MPPLLLVVFLVELAIQAVNSIGAATISNTLWNLYNYFPSKETADHRKLQAECLKVRRELAATSAQDQFAKWGRLDRQHKKMMDELTKKKAAEDKRRRSFDTGVTVLRLALTRGMQYFLPFWYAREPMFWLPRGWFPAYAEWLVSFPRAPRGSISITSWQLACTGVMVLLKDTAAALYELATAPKAAPVPKKEAPVAGAAAESSKDK